MQRISILVIIAAFLLAAYAVSKRQAAVEQPVDSYQVIGSWTGLESKDGEYLALLDDGTRQSVTVKRGETVLVEDFPLPVPANLDNVTVLPPHKGDVAVALDGDNGRRYVLVLTKGEKPELRDETRFGVSDQVIVTTPVF